MRDNFSVRVDEDEDDKDDNNEDDSISKIRQDAGGKTKRFVSRKKTNSSRITELNNEDNSDDASPKAKVGGRHGKAKKSACRKKRTRCGDEEKELRPSLDEPAIFTITPQSWERSG